MKLPEKDPVSRVRNKNDKTRADIRIVALFIEDLLLLFLVDGGDSVMGEK